MSHTCRTPGRLRTWWRFQNMPGSRWQCPTCLTVWKLRRPGEWFTVTGRQR